MKFSKRLKFWFFRQIEAAFPDHIILPRLDGVQRFPIRGRNRTYHFNLEASVGSRICMIETTRPQAYPGLDWIVPAGPYQYPVPHSAAYLGHPIPSSPLYQGSTGDIQKPGVTSAS